MIFSADDRTLLVRPTGSIIKREPSVVISSSVSRSIFRSSKIGFCKGHIETEDGQGGAHERPDLAIDDGQEASANIFVYRSIDIER